MIIVSTTTIPCRKELFLKTIPHILNQTYKFDKYCINIDDNLTEEDYAFYEGLKKLDPRIEITKCEAKWRVNNKLLPTIKKYPDDVVITIDDDMDYEEHCIEELVDVWEKNKDCIVCHEINPAIMTPTGELRYLNTLDVKLYQKEFGKYLTHSCLFPPHIFNNTDVFDYDTMMAMTDGNNDEFWFWTQTTIKGVYVIGLDWTISMSIDSNFRHEKEDYTLTNTNCQQFVIDTYNYRFNSKYGEAIKKSMNENPIIFYVNRENLQAIVASLGQIKSLYGGFYKIIFKVDKTSMKRSHIWYLETRLQMNGFDKNKTKITIADE